MLHASIKAGALFIVPIQDEENKEFWNDLETGQTPPPAAMANEGQTSENLGESTDSRSNCHRKSARPNLAGSPRPP